MRLLDPFPFFLKSSQVVHFLHFLHFLSFSKKSYTNEYESHHRVVWVIGMCAPLEHQQHRAKVSHFCVQLAKIVRFLLPELKKSDIKKEKGLEGRLPSYDHIVCFGLVTERIGSHAGTSGSRDGVRDGSVLDVSQAGCSYPVWTDPM
jgi:hypothetical protein